MKAGLFAKKERAMTKSALGLAILAGTSLLTTGCVRFGAKPPGQLFAISAQTRAPAGETLAADSAAALFVDMPVAPRAIANLRIAVRENDNSYAYIKKAVWVDTPARQFQGLLAETIRTRTGRLVLDPGQYLARRGQMLEGNLLEFGLDAGKKEAVVTYDASLMSVDGQRLTRQRFSHAVPVNEIDGEHAAPALSEAANQVAAQIADWLKAQQQN